MTGSTPAWEAILLAALGSSVLGGGIVSYFTNRQQGRIERDEAWRNRLVEAADDVLPQLRRTADALDWQWLVTVERGRNKLVEEGQSTEHAARIVAAYKDERDKLLLLLSRISVLYGDDVLKTAMRFVRNLDSARAVIEDEAWVGDEIRRVLKEGPARLELRTTDDGSGIPPTFVPGKDKSRGQWAGVLVESAEIHRQEFVAACAARIHSDHPSRSPRRQPVLPSADVSPDRVPRR
jgi:hypothetical protein